MRKGIIEAQWDVILGVIALMLLGFLFGAVIVRNCSKEAQQEVTQQPRTAEEEQGGNEGFNYAAASLEVSRNDLFAQRVMAVGTLLLLGATLVTLIYSVVTTNKNLALTKQNVDAYVQSERGRLRFAAVEPGDGKISTRFKNVGRSYIIIKEVGLMYSVYRVANPSAKGTFDDLTDIVEKDATAAYGGSEATSAYPLQLGDTLKGMNGDGNVPMTVEFSVIYEAPPAGHFRFYGSLVINFSFPPPYLVHTWFPHHEVPTKWEMSAQAREAEEAHTWLREHGHAP